MLSETTCTAAIGPVRLLEFEPAHSLQVRGLLLKQTNEIAQANMPESRVAEFAMTLDFISV